MSDKDMENDDLNMDELGDMDDFDPGFDDFDEGDRKPTIGNISKKLGKEAGKGFFTDLTKKTATKALPDSYSENADTLAEYGEFTKELVDENKSKIEKSLYGLGKEVKKILPFQSKMLEGFLTRYEEDNAKQEEANEEMMRESAIASSIGDIFDKQLETQKVMQATSEAADDERTEKQLESTKLQTNVLTTIGQDIALTTAFKTQIEKEYYKKSLELQFKSYFVQADLLKTTKDSFKAFSMQLDSISKNTGLPDFVKMRTSEAVKEVMRQKTVEAVHGSVFSNNKYIQGVKDKVRRGISNKVSSLTDGIGNVTEALSGINSATGSSAESMMMMAEIGAGMAGGSLGGKLAERIPQEWLDRIKNNRQVQAGGSILGALSSGPASFFSNLKAMNKSAMDAYEDESTIGRGIRSKFHKLAGGLLDFTDIGPVGGRVEEATIMDHNKAAIFDNKVHRSITETIPLYLSKILKENTDLRTMFGLMYQGALSRKGYKGSTELKYDYQNRRLATKDDIVQNLQNTVLDSRNTRGKMSGLSSQLLSVDQKGLSKEDRNLLKSQDTSKALEGLLGQLHSKGVQNVDFKELTDFSKTVETEGFEKAMQKASMSKSATMKALTKDPEFMKQHFEKGSKITKALSIVGDKSSGERLDSLNTSYSDASRVYPARAAKEFFRAVSIVAGVPNLNLVSDDVGSAFTEALFRFKTTSSSGGMGRIATVEDIANGNILMTIKASQKNLMEGPMTILIQQIKTALRRDDGVSNWKLIQALALVQAEADSLEVFTPEVYQTLHDAFPDILDSKNLSQEQLVEGKLTTTKFESAWDKSELRSVTRATKGEVEGFQIKATETHFEKAMGTHSKNFSERLKANTENQGRLGSVKGVIKALKDTAKEVSEDIGKKAKEIYNSTAEKASGLADELSNLTDSVSITAIQKFSVKLKGLSSSLQDSINAETQSLPEKINLLRDTEREAKNLTNVDSTDFEKEIKQLEKISASKVKVLESLKSDTDRLALDLDEIVNRYNNSSPEERADMKNILSQVVSRMREYSAKVKEQTQTAEALES